MKNKLKHLLCGISTLCLAGSLVFASPIGSESVQASSNYHSTDGTVHFLTLPDNTDAILLECDGKFGMVDSGEDSDYPHGNDSRYPLRPGVTTGNGYEGRVISYLQELGVNSSNFEFYIGTHPHSDHIGSADEVIRTFHPKRVYIEPYSDKDITDETHLWDNLYVYDQMVSAAKDTGATLIQYFNEDAPLYPETVSVKGSITWIEPEITVDPEPTTAPQPTAAPETTTESERTPESKQAPGSSSLEEFPDSSDTSIDSKDGLQEAPSTSDTEAGTENSSDESSVISSESDPVSDNNTTISDVTVSKAAVSTVHQLSLSEASNLSVASLSTDSTSPGETGSSGSTSSESSVAPPSVISVKLSWGTTDNQSVTLTTGSNSANGTITQIDENHWEYEFRSVPKYDDNKSAYTYKVAPAAADGYSFTPIDDSKFDFSCTLRNKKSETTVPTVSPSADSGVIDEQPDDSVSGTSDNLVTANIPSSDRVVAGSDIDMTNANRNDRAIAGKSSIHDDSTGSVSTPVFYLGDTHKLRIEIMNIGVSRPQPDANYFSLGVKVTNEQTHTTAFLSGDINNYIGAETELASKLGHVNLLKIGHHGCYGSNTYKYIKTLSPNMAVMTGMYNYVSNATIGDEYSTVDTLFAMASRGTPLYVTGWYSNDVKALVFHLNPSLNNNVPSGKSLVATGWLIDGSNTVVYYENGFPTNCSGWKKDLYGNYYYFQNSSIPLMNQFIQDQSTWYYLNEHGRRVTGWVFSGGAYYYMNPSDGSMVTGWIQLNNKWYYLGSNGAMYTGTHTIDGSEYTFDSSGAMVTSLWVGNHYYGSDGKWIPNYHNTNWRKDANGFWYIRANGSYPVNTWELIDGTWYYFDQRGYMVTGWLRLGSNWYYLNTDGSLHIGWLKLGNDSYYMDSSGVMITGWGNVSGSWYYFTGSGAMYGKGWHVINNKYYYMYNSGRTAINTWIGDSYVDGSGAWIPGKARYSTGWIQDGARWWYRHQDGRFTKDNWEFINNNWYFFDQSGWMVTGWLKRGNTWYYLSGSGAMATGWINLGGTWYYLNGNGAMASNTWIGSSYVNGSGAWVPNQLSIQTGWIRSGSQWWYRHQDGSFTRNGWEFINGRWYYFNQSGWMVTGWIRLGNTWYYLSSSGAMATGWINLGGTWYYLYGSGAMAANTRIGSWYVNYSGAWVPGR